MRILSATRVMLQKELIIQNTKLLLKMIISNLKKTWTNMALFQSGLAKSDTRQLPWPKVKLKDDILTIFDFTFPFLMPFHKMGNKQTQIICESSLLHIFYNIRKYTFILNFIKRFEIMVAATLGKNLGPPMPKRSNDSYLQKKQEL